MALDDARSYTVRELEDLADQYRQRAGLDDLDIPVEVDLIAESVADLTIDEWPALRTHHSVTSGVWREQDSGDLTLYIAQEIMDDTSPGGMADYQLALAEAIGFLALYPSVAETLDGPAAYAAMHQHPRWEEVQGNIRRFARALLRATAQPVHFRIDNGMITVCPSSTKSSPTGRASPLYRFRRIFVNASRPLS